MRITSFGSTLVVVVFLLLGCGSSALDSVDGGALDVAQQDGPRADADLRPDAEPPCLTANGAIIYFNRSGGTYQSAGEDDSRTNATTMIASQTLDAWPYGDDNWAAVLACARDALRAFNVQVVDTDPGNVQHHEIVFTTITGMFDSIGVAPWMCGMTIPNSISFVFGDNTGNDPWWACRAAMYDLGGVLGLDVSNRCEDFMSYGTCQNMEWVDEAVSCGAYAVSPCCTGLPTQNSFQTLFANFGACP